jgi:hypothetical protein
MLISKFKIGDVWRKDRCQISDGKPISFRIFEIRTDGSAESYYTLNNDERRLMTLSRRVLSNDDGDWHLVKRDSVTICDKC